MQRSSDRTQLNLRTPGQTTRTTRRGAPIARVIALSGVVGLFACQDATSPEAKSGGPAGLADPAASVAQTLPTGMIGGSIVDATTWVLSSINDLQTRSNMKAAIKSLADHLVSGQLDAARADVTNARAVLASVDAVDAAEIGPIGVSLDEADKALADVGK